MAWSIELPLLLRHLIDDYNEPREYTDKRLESLIVSAAQLTIATVDFPKDYSVDVVGRGISPDPTDSPKDNGFINLITLKAACLLATGDYRSSSNKGLVIKDGPSSIDARVLVESKKELAETLCKDYTDAELEYRLGNSSAGEAIIGPHRSDYSGGNTSRQRPEFS